MVVKWIKKIWGSRNERTLNRIHQVVAKIEALEPEMQALTADAFILKTRALKMRVANGESLEQVLPEAFALVREASVRTLGLRHFSVQLIGGIVLHEGNIAEMRTGEGKTLTETLPAYLNALTDRGVHIVTVNEYLAKRDSEWMRPIFEYLGLTVGVIYSEMPHAEKQQAYACDIVYGTNNEFGFDYLRDNMAFSLSDKVQKGLHFAIVDEVDSIFIDEPRTPLVISGAAEDSSSLYVAVNRLIPSLTLVVNDAGDYTLDEKQKQAHLTEEGHQKIEALLVEAQLLPPGDSLYHPSHIILMHHVNAALRAHVMYHRDVDYIVQNNQIVIVDEHTGRTMPGRRWSEGLHQAIEAKEGVSIQNENQTLASITFQNFFRLYDKLAGMTGTADTEAYEFHEIYGLDVVVIPTNRPMIRIDEPDLVYLTQEDKYQAIIKDVQSSIAKGQPVLVGTASIEASEILSQRLKKAGIQHQVLNAKFHEKEAHIIAEAGRAGVVTIATNMAGRGTDIVLGGSLNAMLAQLPETATEEEREAVRSTWQTQNAAVIAAGGLRIIGSERHESRRIDNQLRGRAGRQGDPGSSRFYLSLEDPLMRIFASDRVATIMRRLGMQPGEPIEHALVTKAIENAQKKLEGHHFDIRKQLLAYDNVANEQRKVIYAERLAVISMSDPSEAIRVMREEVVSTSVDIYIPPNSLEEQWDVSGLETVLNEEFNLGLSIKQWIDNDHHIESSQIKEKIIAILTEKSQQKAMRIGQAEWADLQKSIILQHMDSHWREHLAAMDYLRQGIHLRGYAQKDPKQEYKREAFELFSAMLFQLKYDIIKLLSVIEWVEATEEAPKVYPKVGRNDLCPCHSGKKYKSCHGQLL